MSSGLHHAYLLVGRPEEAELYISVFLVEEEIPRAGNPDFLHLKFPTFGIPEARTVTHLATRKSFSGKKVFFIVPERLTLEAQNALLKTFEEPIADTHFFLVTYEEDLILPTLRSRMRVVRLAGGEAKSQSNTDAESFLKLSLSKRIEFAKEFADDELNLPVFLDGLLMHLRLSGAPLEKVKEVFSLRHFASDRSASARLILEHLALVV